MKGCMNCGNISCGNNKKRDCAGCGRWISPEDKIKELEAQNTELMGTVEGYDRNRDRLIAMGFPHFRNCKEYAEKLKELEKENERLTVSYETLKLHDEEEIGMLKSENAELKEKLKPENCLKLLAKEGYIKFTSEQLTKAKEIIKYLCGMVRELNKPNVQLTNVDYSLSEAEQFLSEVEK